jgi:hypothetical protein
VTGIISSSPDTEVLVGNLHRRFDREDLSRLERRRGPADIVHLHADGVAEASRHAGAIPVDFVAQSLRTEPVPAGAHPL